MNKKETSIVVALAATAFLGLAAHKGGKSMEENEKCIRYGETWGEMMRDPSIADMVNDGRGGSPGRLEKIYARGAMEHCFGKNNHRAAFTKAAGLGLTESQQSAQLREYWLK